MRHFRIISGVFLTLLLLFMAPQPVKAESEQDIYDSLRESIKANWKNGMEGLETTEEIEIKGPVQIFF